MYAELLPVAMQCGMTPEQFWTGEPRLLDCYIRKRELELDDINYQAWLFGLYTHKAFATTMANAFAKKGSEPQIYFKEPIKELNSNYRYKKENKISDQRTQYNYWASLKKRKGGK